MGISKWNTLFKQCSPAAEYFDFPLYFPPPQRRSRLPSSEEGSVHSDQLEVAAPPPPPVDAKEDEIKAVWAKYSSITPAAQKCAYAARSLGFAPSQADAAALHEEVGGGDVSYDQFKQWLSKINAISANDSVDSLIAIFKEYDTMNTGQLPITTVRNILCSYGEALTAEEANAIFSELGVTGTRVDYRDFVEKLLAGD